MANKKGKWYKVIQGLLQRGAVVDFGKEPDHQAKVDLLMTKIWQEEPRTSSHYATEYAKLRVEQDELKAKLSDVGLGIDAYFQLMYNAYEAEGIHILGLTSGGSVAVQEEPHAVVKDREKFRLWCIANGFEQQLALAWQTTNALTKQYLEQGENPPDGVEAVPRPKAVYRRGADKED
jgi:hypothetical protein